jgi:hypothetical protein
MFWHVLWLTLVAATGLRPSGCCATSLEWGLLFGGRGEREAGSCVSRVIGWCDADSAGCIDSRKSTSGRVFVLNGAAVSWASRKQSTVSNSTTEAEFIATADACKEALWLRNLVRDFDRHQDTVDIFSDSTCALALIRNPVHHSRAKHIDVHHKFVRNRACRGEVKFMYCPTKEMIADVLTKPLGAPAFERCRKGMGVYPPPEPPAATEPVSYDTLAPTRASTSASLMPCNTSAPTSAST